MNMEEIYPAIITLIGVLAGHFITKQNNDRNNYHQYITDERRKWRSDIRKLTLELYKDDIFWGNNCKALKSKFKIRLNPKDPEDKLIMKCFDDLIEILQTLKQCEDDNRYEEFNDKREELVERIALLLKHDWERVKVESNSLTFFPKGVYILVYLTCIMGVLFLIKIFRRSIDMSIESFICILILIGWLIVVLRIFFMILQDYLKNNSKFDGEIKFIKETFNIPRRITYEEIQKEETEEKEIHKKKEQESSNGS